MAGEPIFVLGDGTKLWVIAQVYEGQLPLVKEGMDVTVSLAHRTEESVPGKVTYVYPYLVAETRTNPVRIEMHHRMDHFKPDTYVNVDIHVDSGTKLSVPKDAILDSGTQKIVFVDHGDGMLEPRKISVGISGDTHTEVIEGLQIGETVVTAATFFIDSESRLKSALERMGAPAGGRRQGHRGDGG